MAATKLAIMQPYLFPYLGYFQLVAAVDKFVFYDDVNYIKSGWINRNRIKVGERVTYITVPVSSASSYSSIKDTEVQRDGRWQARLLKTIRQSYARAPHFDATFPMVEEVLGSDCRYIAEFARNSVKYVSSYLGLGTCFVESSSKYGNTGLKGAERLIDICRMEEAACYLNLPGGRGLYNHADFAGRGIKLCFIEPALSEYDRGSSSFVPGLSIIDVLMFNAPDSVRQMLASATIGEALV